MTWGRLDDQMYAHPKVRRALNIEPASIALFAMAISWSAGHEQDGHVPEEAMQMLYPAAKKRKKALDVLDEVGLIQRNGDGGYVIHDYLDYNLSRDQLNQRRAADRGRKSGSERRPTR